MPFYNPKKSTPEFDQNDDQYKLQSPKSSYCLGSMPNVSSERIRSQFQSMQNNMKLKNRLHFAAS